MLLTMLFKLKLKLAFNAINEGGMGVFKLIFFSRSSFMKGFQNSFKFFSCL